ncbi:carboxypeptidase-like regulatory domain-containing protein [Mucilaginibacter myungsuensis]|uniref:TonB-dependent receptor n=1 Tax=Mucilaginibacter myungsuensis TaxID=649104 RepID=A0A929KZ72_9SPHI|nr:carboxypeptidase-like regulatory domain-containing protein [Mucilaginibacter myungsuensis]MBE9662648.1 TonB-dependent receptor [Mucilaginibacter myungsuensis]MDN3598068.1 TonB-dependent receptor [Mucilaginibacter myungsuensis]
MKKTTGFIAPILLIALTAIAFKYKNDQLEKLFSRLERFNKEYPQEKVHLQLDKPYYSVGEDIWLKAYVVNAERNVLSDQSKILYVDLLDDRDSVKQTLLLPLANGLADANIHLNDSLLSTGKYHLFAYSKWMNNFGSESFFRKDISIVNALRGAVSGDMQYKAVVNDKGKTITSEILFKDENGSTYANKPVTYTISIGGKKLGEVKGTTDASGKLVISKDIKDELKDANVVISTTLAPQPGKSISQNFVIKPLASVADVQFFPEGGTLVAGLRTKLGFKAIKPDGLGGNVSGFITEDGGARLVDFKSDHAGMGTFALQPSAGKNYTAVITHEDGSVKRYALPKAAASGYVLNVNRMGDSIAVRISASAGLIDNREVTIVAQSNGLVQFAGHTKMDRASNVSYIPLKKFQSGITQFTLFAPDMAPIAERLIFVDHNDQLSTEIKPDKLTYTKRSKVDLDLTLTDALGQPVVGSFSVSVTDEGKVKQDENDETSILSNLLLTSDIRGHIEKPNYYFNPANPERGKHLDQLLLTQGWRRFSWTNLQSGQLPAIKHPHEKSLTVSGLVTTFSGKPIPKGKVSLFSLGNGFPMMMDTVADYNGRYAFEGLNISDSAKLIVRATNAKDRATVKVTIEPKKRIPFINPDHSVGQVADNSLADYLKNTQQHFTELGKWGLMKNTTALAEVKIKAKRDYIAEKTIPHSANLDPGHADYVLKKDRFERYTRFLDAMYGLAGIEVKAGKLFNLRVGGSSLSSNGAMLIVIDGAQIPEAVAPEVLQSLNAGDILGVELLIGGSRAIYGQAGNAGVAVITTKRGGEDNVYVPSLNVAHYTPRGYTPTKQFYAPAYDTAAEQSKMSDLRSTIYWDPNVVTDDAGKAKLSFYNADGTGNYRVTLEGIDTHGKLARKVYTYMVN